MLKKVVAKSKWQLSAGEVSAAWKVVREKGDVKLTRSQVPTGSRSIEHDANVTRHTRTTGEDGNET